MCVQVHPCTYLADGHSQMATTMRYSDLTQVCVERLQVANLTFVVSNKIHLLNPNITIVSGEILPTSGCLMVAIDDENILIIGGVDIDQAPRNKTYLFNTRSLLHHHTHATTPKHPRSSHPHTPLD